MQKRCVLSNRGRKYSSPLSETIDSLSILKHPHVAYRHTVVISWSIKPYSKSVLGSGVDLSWISFDNVLARFIEDIELLSWDAKSKTYRSQRWTQRRRVELSSFDDSISSCVVRAKNCIEVIIISNWFWMYVLFFDEADSNKITPIEWPVEFAGNLIHAVIL